ncbi:MAG: UDP-N-acetylglucosamine 1-carboxyvinyltransferase [Butyrivibrio sp.]
MSYLKVNGKKRLEGELKIQGSKNSCLPMVAASLLAADKVILKNCPDITDIREMTAILKYLGCKCTFENNTLEIDSSRAVEKTLPPECKKLRASMIFMGAMLGRFKRVIMPHPGGCNLGGRPIDFHMEGYKILGGNIAEDDDIIAGIFENSDSTVCYSFPRPSLGALENLLLGAVSRDGITVFTNCTREPEIVDFCHFLTAMGADISGAGTDKITVRGGVRLSGCTMHIPGDRIVAGTYLAALCIAGGNIKLTGIDPRRMTKPVFYLRKMGVHIFTDYKSNEIIGVADLPCRSYNLISAKEYPGLATDMQPQLMAAACFLCGTTGIRDNVYPGRYGIARELRRMGANISFATESDQGETDNRIPAVYVRGSLDMQGARVYAKDLRGGAALVIAALGCAGISEIHGCSHISRGYEDIQRDLKHLGADIEWKDGTEGILPEKEY